MVAYIHFSAPMQDEMCEHASYIRFIYVNMHHNDVNMRLIYVNYQKNYDDMQHDLSRMSTFI